MALDRQNFTLQLGQGIDTKSDPKQVVAGKLLLLENATFQTTNQLTKCNGSTELAAGSLSLGNAINSFQGELVAMNGLNFYSYDQAENTMISKGPKLALEISATSINKNSYTQNSPDSAVMNGIAVYAWEEYTGSSTDIATTRVGYKVVDTATGQVIISAVTGFNKANPKVLRCGQYIAVIITNSSSINTEIVINTINPSVTTGLSASFGTVGSTTKAYDACEIVDANGNSTGILVAGNGNSGQLNWTKCDTSFVTSATQSVAGINATKVAVFTNSPSTVVRIAYYDGTAFKVYHDVIALGTITGPYTIETISNVANITGIFIDSLSTCRYFYEINNTTTNSLSDNYIRNNYVIGTSVSTPYTLIRSLCLWSKPFVNNYYVYLIGVYVSTLQSTYFVINTNDASVPIVAKIAPGNGGGQAKNILRQVNKVSTGNYQTTYLLKDLVQSVNGNVYTQTGVNSLSMAFDLPLTSESLGNGLNISGGLLSLYDSQTIAEQNFNIYPENISVQSSTAGGGLSQGSYQYTAIYEWMDSQGQIHQSTPAVPVTITTTAETDYIYPNQNGTQVDLASVNHGVLYFNTNQPVGNPSTYPNAVQIGQGVTGTNIPANTYIVDVRIVNTYPTQNIYAKLNNFPTATAVFPTDSTTQTFTFPGSSTTGSKTITLDQNVAATYTGSFTNGSTTVQMNTTEGLHVGQTIQWAGNQFCVNATPPLITITAVGTSTITISSAATQTVTQNIIVLNLFNATFYAGTAYCDVTLTNTTDLPFYVGQRILRANNNLGMFAPVPWGATATTDIRITGWSQLSGTTFRVNMNSSPSTALANAPTVFGVTQYHFLSVGKSVTPTANFSGSLKITAKTPYTITVDQKASGSGSMAVQTSIGAASVVTVPTLRLTDKPTTMPVSIAIYRTLVNSTTFYRLTSYSSPLLNSKTIDQVSFVDTTLDTTLIGNELLYTSGGVLANCAPPSLKQLTQYKNRLIGVAAEDPYTWWFSKPIGTNIPVQFCPYFYKKIPEFGGPITALAVMDDKLLFFKRSSIYMIVGQGPNNLGLQDDFTDAELITTDTGCIEPKSIVRTPMGIMYKSAKGIYLLNRGLNVQYIGAPVEAYNSVVVTNAELIENVNQVRIGLQNSVSLVYDYYFDQWSVFTNQNVADACLHQNKYTYIRPDGKIYKETPGVWTDGGSPIYLKLKTSWLSLNGLQGLERIYNMMILGQYKSPHTLTAKVYHEFGSTASQTTAIPVLTDPGIYQYKVYMNRQKTDALQIELAESQNGPSYLEGLSISAISLEAGVKKGTNTLPSGKLYG